MAAHFGLTPQGIYYVLNRAISVPMPKLASTKRTIEYLRRWARRTTKPQPQPAPSHVPETVREERVRGPGALVTLNRSRLVKRRRPMG